MKLKTAAAIVLSKSFWQILGHKYTYMAIEGVLKVNGILQYKSNPELLNNLILECGAHEKEK